MDLTQLSPEKRNLFDQFANNVTDCRLPEYTTHAHLIKWLIAREFDLAKSETMFRQSLEWRQINQVDTILDKWTPPEVLTRYYSLGATGHDKFHCPVWINAFGRMDMTGILQSVTKRDYLRYMVYITEMSHRLMMENALRSGKPVSYQTIIIDMADFSVNQMSKQFMDIGMETTNLFVTNYPEGVRRVFVINVPQVFSVGFNLVKPFLSAATLAKLRIFSQDAKAWKDALLEEIDADQLPAHYGGTMTDPDGNPFCLTKINMGGEVPKSYYINNKKPENGASGAHLKSELVPAGNRKRIEIIVEEAKSLMRWEFMTEDGDVGFQINCVKKEDGKEVIVLPRARVDSHQMMEAGEIVCVYSGTYVIEFDNSYSYFRSKKLWYSIDVSKCEP
ncbi:SEC14-like protein 2 [Daphnia pulicaria]|uniref:SEC14-like protein 2 n=1 Tax=Daphnia pulicaria TaxID=35523 RepID=UPI001EEA4A61|nr:SEC14-like protein 2 [Daphnia pulicaria]